MSDLTEGEKSMILSSQADCLLSTLSQEQSVLSARGAGWGGELAVAMMLQT